MKTTMRQLAAAVIIAFSGLTVNAQSYNNPYSRYTQADEHKSYGLFFAEYDNLSRYYTNDAIEDEDQSFHGVSIGGSYFLSIAKPLGIEAGIKGQYFFRNKSLGMGFKDKSNMFAATVPVNAVLNWQIDDFAIAPFAGVYGRYNFSAENVLEIGGQRTTTNLFDSEQTDETMKRFQMGWQAGLYVNIDNTVTIGGAYWNDFNEMLSARMLRGFSFLIGINF